MTTTDRLHSSSVPSERAPATIPLVAVLTGHYPDDRASVHRTYLNAVWLAGGQPVILSPPPPGALSRALEVVERCDALLLTGGGDVEPGRYGEPARARLMEVDEARDTVELAAVDHAVAAGRPVLGVCRGMQVLAVALGGRLHQDVPTAGFANHWDDLNPHAAVHTVRTAPGSLAARLLGERQKVNSVHHQAVADPGPHLVATAWSDDDLIEAVEAADGRLVLGVQWHPERLACPPSPDQGDPAHLAAFEWLVAATGHRPGPRRTRWAAPAGEPPAEPAGGDAAGGRLEEGPEPAGAADRLASANGNGHRPAATSADSAADAHTLPTTWAG